MTLARRPKRWLRPSKPVETPACRVETPKQSIAGRICVPRCAFWLHPLAQWWYGEHMINAALLVMVALQAPAGSSPSAAPPQNAPPSRLIERQQVRPSRVRARENLARDPNEPDPAAIEPEATPEIAEPVPVPAPAPAPTPIPAPAVQPAPTLAPMAPSAMAPGSSPASPTVSPSIGAPPAARGGTAKFVFDPQPLAPLTMLVGPAIGALWLVSRRSFGSAG
jgi:hypothetical protein